MGPGLGPGQAVSLMSDLVTVGRFAADEGVGREVAETVARLRRVTEGPGRKRGAGESPATTPHSTEGLPGLA
jgi:hypothetical protein